MSDLQTPKHKATRTFLRVLGPVIALVGLAFLIVGVVSFFSAMNSHEQPGLFWCCFVGMPLLFVGAVMCQFAFMGAIARYTVAEQAPVAKDAVNYMAEETQGAVKTVARAVTQGVVEGMQSSQPKNTKPK